MTTLAKALIAAGILILMMGMLLLSQCQSTRNAKTETRLNKGQAGAAVESGRDSVNTVGNRAATDAAGDAITRENDNAIRNADGASAPVADGVRDAGIASVCRRAAYRGDPRCVLGADSR